MGWIIADFEIKNQCSSVLVRVPLKRVYLAHLRRTICYAPTEMNRFGHKEYMYKGNLTV